jgi:type I protein arginine methyltransferase
MDYQIKSYGSHIRDKVRVDAYVEAMRRVITPESVVLDLGAGTGFFSLMACHLGAKHVYAIEVHPAVKLLDKQAKANGWEDRITVFQEKSTDVELPEKVDVIVSDLRGGMSPLLRTHIQTLYDAKQRFLKDNGVLIPQNDTLYITVVDDDRRFTKYVRNPWMNPDFPFDMTAVYEQHTNTPFRKLPDVENIVLPEQVWASIDYGQQSSPQVRNTVQWQVEAPTMVHFISLWFESRLIDGVSYSTSPRVEEDTRPQCYSGMYFPFKAPVNLQAGETLQVEVIATYVAARDNYTFTWNTTVCSDETQECRVSYRQSTFFQDLFPKF